MTPATPSPGARIGPYEVVGWLGAGGMGEVFRARDPRLGRDVAIKLITGVSAADPGRIRRFEQEARAAGQLNHPSVLVIYDTGVHEGAPYIVSELLEGESLRSRLQKSALPARKAIDYARQAAEGLAAAHDRGIIHRDVKPDNLFVTADGRIKILDFGIAKLTASTESELHTGAPTDTAVGAVVGTARYMSPEQVRGEAVDARSDIFSLGVVLYEMVSGRAAFARPTPADTMAAILNEDPPEPAEVADAPALARIVSRCLEKTREARFQSARDLAFGLDVLTTSQRTAPIFPMRTSRWRAAAAAAIVVLGAGAAAIWWMRAAPPSIESQLAGAAFAPLTDFDGSESDAAISPDGKFVAFLGDRGGKSHIWLTQVGTGEPLDLTPNQGDMHVPGPNRTVGFVPEGPEVWISDGNRNRIVVVPLMGGTPRSFLNETAVNVTWSPDGSQLAYFTSDGDPLIVADAKGENGRPIIKAKQGDHNHYPAFSIDGQWIYYVHSEKFQPPTQCDIWRIPAAGGTPERLAELHTDVKYLTPFDARTVLYIAPAPDRSGPWLWALDVDQKKTRRLSVGLERYLSIAANADRRRFVATVAKSTASLWSVPIRGQAADQPAGERDVERYPMTAPALAPRLAGDTLFYLSTGAREGLWRYQDGHAQQVLRASDAPITEPPAISKNGDRLAVLLPTAGKLRVTLTAPDGGNHRPLTEAVDARGTSAWSPDGKWIAVGGSDDKGPGLFKVPIDGGPPVRLFNGPAFNPAVSPDGAIIVFGGQQGAFAPLLALRADDGRPVALPPISVSTDGHGRWRFLDDTRLIYMQGGVGVQNFWLLDVASRESHAITNIPNPAAITTFDISPDRKRIVFDRVREQSDIELIDLPKQR